MNIISMCLDLRNLYDLLKPVGNGLDVLKEEVQKHIQNIGLDAVNNSNGENVRFVFGDIFVCL